jgi:hypothetical protein
MLYARIIFFATLLCVIGVSACTTCPVESAVEPTIPAYEDPCKGLVYEVVPYHDEHNLQFGPGGTVRSGGTAGHLLHFPSGKTLAEVRVRIVPRHHDGSLPTFLPTLDVRKETEIGDGPVLFTTDPFQVRLDAADPSVATEYDEPHNIVIEPGWLTEGGTYYYVSVGGEAGPEALDFELCGTAVTLAR